MQITHIQFDPNGFCNSKCWYCPVRYEELPTHSNMSIDDVKICFDNILDRVNYEVKMNPFIYTAHYNEILLYPYLQQFLEILRERNLKTIILSNGTPLTYEKWEMLNNYTDVIKGINLNISAFSKESWALQTGFSDNHYFLLHKNLIEIHDMYTKDMINFSIVMNGMSDHNLIAKMKNFPEYISIEQYDKEFNDMISRYPKFHIYKNTHLIDRNSIMEKHNIYTTKMNIFLKHQKGRKNVIGCDRGEGNRFNKWLHVNCKGNVFVCCNDYHYDYVFGNLLIQKLEDIWNSPLHIEMKNTAARHMCKNCPSAQWQ